MAAQHSYTLAEISLWAQNHTVSLPTVQRGFVWKPSQIENLWDSLLRGFPVGAFVLSHGGETARGAGCLDLLDGQQRATAICLGFGNDTFRRAPENARVFIDLDSPKFEDNRKYIFRAITRSHPWGYQANDNTKTLDSEKIRKAMGVFRVKDHLKEPLDSFFPYDALLPVPLHLFLQGAVAEVDDQALLESIFAWKHWNQIYRSWEGELQKLTGAQKEPPALCSKEAVKEKICRIFQDVKAMLDPENGRRIPALYLDLAAILATQDAAHAGEPPVGRRGPARLSGDEEPKSDEIENLFIRLNSGGTPLRGEELNYSILKAHIDVKLQDEIETSCSRLFNPARFITIAYRLFQLKMDSNARDTISMKIKPKQFQRTITGLSDLQPGERRPVDDFKEYLVELIGAPLQGGRTLLEYVSDILVYHKDSNPLGLPYLTVSRLSNQAPEVMFMLMYRIKVAGDRFPDRVTSDLHKRMLGMVTLFTWYGKGEKQRDHAKLLSNIWPAAKSLKSKAFWSSATVQRAQMDEVLPVFPAMAALETLNALKIPRTEIWSKFDGATDTTSVIKKIFLNRELVLYAQRHAMAEWFDDILYYLDDTNVPFDWDHIFPNRYVKKKQKIPQVLRDSYNTNGNFRAWPYPLNRCDRDDLPFVKLNPLCTDSPRRANREEYEEIVGSWNEYFAHRPQIMLSGENLSQQLLSWSFCPSKWAHPKLTDVKQEYKEVYKLIIERNVAIYREWHNNLLIESLFQVETKTSFEMMINLKKWRPMPEEMLEYFEDYEDTGFWVSRALEVRGTKLYMFLGYPEVDDDPCEILREDVVIFGILEVSSDGVLCETQIYDDDYQQYDNYIGNEFTLISHHKESYIQLFSGFYHWLEDFPIEEVKGMAQIYLEDLKGDYGSKIVNFAGN
jgi:hypothetical protein